MKHTLPWCAAAALAAIALFLAWGRLTFVPLGLVATGATLLAILLGVLAALVYAFGRREMNDATRLTLRMSAIGITFFLSSIAALPLVKIAIIRDVNGTKHTALQLTERLDAFYAMRGTFPTNLHVIAGSQPLPRLLARREAYHATATNFTLRLRIPGNPLDEWRFESQTRTWYLTR